MSSPVYSPTPSPQCAPDCRGYDCVRRSHVDMLRVIAEQSPVVPEPMPVIDLTQPTVHFTVKTSKPSVRTKVDLKRKRNPAHTARMNKLRREANLVRSCHQQGKATEETLATVYPVIDVEKDCNQSSWTNKKRKWWEADPLYTNHGRSA